MQDTVDQAYGAVPRTLANIIEDVRRAACKADARPPGVWDVWIARLVGKDPGSIEGNDGGPAATQQAGVPGEAALGQGRPAASQHDRDALSCPRRSDHGMASRTAANHEGYRQIDDGYRADRSARLPAPAPRSPPGRTTATVVLPGLLARTYYRARASSR